MKKILSTKEKLKKVAVELLIKGWNIHDITTEIIAQYVGIRKASLFFHYETKEQLLIEAIKEIYYYSAPTKENINTINIISFQVFNSRRLEGIDKFMKQLKNDENFHKESKLNDKS